MPKILFQISPSSYEAVIVFLYIQMKPWLPQEQLSPWRRQDMNTGSTRTAVHMEKTGHEHREHNEGLETPTQPQRGG